MAEGGSFKYGRLFTEEDVLGLLRFGINRGFDLITKPGVADLTLEQVVREYEAEHGLTFPADEPLFLLRGQDRLSWASVEHYAVHCDVASDISADHASAAHDAADAIHEWQAEHLGRVKIPD